MNSNNTNNNNPKNIFEIINEYAKKNTLTIKTNEKKRRKLFHRKKTTIFKPKTKFKPKKKNRN